jgi:hypothetical protein
MAPHARFSTGVHLPEVTEFFFSGFECSKERRSTRFVLCYIPPPIFWRAIFLKPLGSKFKVTISCMFQSRRACCIAAEMPCWVKQLVVPHLLVGFVRPGMHYTALNFLSMCV